MSPSRRLLCLLSLALAPLLVGPALAAFGDTHRPSALPWSDVVRVPGFDPSQGELRAVRLSIDTFVRADLRAENVGEVPQLVCAHAVALVSVQLPSGAVVAEVPFDAAAQWVLAPFDGAVDYAGPSGRTVAPGGRRTIQVQIDDPALLLEFLGEPGDGGFVEFPVHAIGSTSMLGGRPLVTSAHLDAGVRVRAQYLMEAGS